MQLLRRFSRDAVALRLKHLSLVRRGAESHTIVAMVSLLGPCMASPHPWNQALHDTMSQNTLHGLYAPQLLTLSPAS